MQFLTFCQQAAWACGAMLALLRWMPAASAQTTGPAPSASAAASRPAASAPARPASAAKDDAAQTIEITGTRDNDTDQRRRSTAAKIVIGREEIDKFGDATVGEVLRRLPGVTTPGAPGHGGPPRLRGLGNGYTQLLIDGQRVPPGFSLEQLTPEQVERIEILRAPTAETGARAIAGTINIVTREGFRRRLNDLRLGSALENGRTSPGINWTHNDNAGPLTYNISGSGFLARRKSHNDTQTTVQDLGTGALVEDRTLANETADKRIGLNLTGRLQWRLNDSGDSLMLMPSVFHTRARSLSAFTLRKDLPGATTPAYDSGSSVADSDFTVGRLNGQWRQRVGIVRLEGNGGASMYRADNDSARVEQASGNASPLRTLMDRSRSRERSYNLTLKASGNVGADPVAEPAASGHDLASGVEVEGIRRNEARDSSQRIGAVETPLLAGFGSDLKATSLRLAAYGQDEWNLSPQWSASAGLRWESIVTQGDRPAPDDPSADQRPRNRSAVWTPLLHAVWKPDAKSRDQVRLSLTRSYRAPSLGTLIARPSISRDYPIVGPNAARNTSTSPDTVGNPDLKPELATGLDLALERYLEGGGILSANVFVRHIKDLQRGVTSLQPVSYSSTSPRWVRRTENIGDATTEGLELEAKFRLDQLITEAPRIELRNNLSLYRSQVKSIPGPDNRLDQQAKATANVGGDYRLRIVPLTLGGNVNWVPGYRTRTEVDQTVTVSTKVVWDGYALWTFSPTVGLRLLGNNLIARRYANTTADDVATQRTTVRSVGPSEVNWQLRLELKL